MPNLSAKENFGLEKQAPCKYTNKYLLVLYVTANQPASKPAPSELMPNNRDLSKKPSCITNKNKGKFYVPEELAALVFNMFWPTKQTKGKLSRYPESLLLGYNMFQPTNQKNV
jgi:hypothetical protein